MKNKFKIGDKVEILSTGEVGEVQDISTSTMGRSIYKVSGTEFSNEFPFYDEDIRFKSDFGGKKYDSGKPDLSLVDRSLVEAAARSLMFGANKYGRDNYKKGLDPNRVYASLLRHIFARMSGEIYDPESGLDHIDHMAANIQFLAFYNKNKGENNGR